MLQAGDKIPDLAVLDDQGQTVRLADFAGQKLIIYFYPKDSTPGCTNEAVSFTVAQAELASAGFKILGISADSPKSHRAFKEKYNLSVMLLSDPDKAVIQAFGAYGEKKMYGKTTMGIIRSTFLVDETGTISKVYPKVKAAGHGAAVLEDIRTAGL